MDGPRSGVGPNAAGGSRHEQVHDFGWIKDGPSPNWRLASTDQVERVRDELDLLHLPDGGHRPSREVGDTIRSLLDAAAARS